VPFIEQFTREREAVGVAFGIETAAGIAVPVPGAAEIARRFEHGRVDAEIDQLLDLVNAGHAGTDNNHLIMGFGRSHHSLLRNFALGPMSSITISFADAGNRLRARATRDGHG